MKVLFDDQAFSSQRRGGISNYFAQLIRQFELEPDLGIEPIGLPILSFNQHLGEVGKSRTPRISGLERRRLLQLLNAAQNAGRSLTGRLRPDLIHYTHYRNTGWRSGRHIPVTVTVHDMMPELFPQDFGAVNPHFNKDYHIRNADSIACVSTTTKIDLMRLYPDLDVPIVVTPLGVSPEFVPSKESANENYFMFVGKRGAPYKNFQLFIDAAARVIRDNDVTLKLVGGGPISPAERQILLSSGVADRIEHSSPTQSELVTLYQRAIALVFPSRYEGFGLPTLEAMASGCPVIIGPTAALLEVAGEAALEFEEFSAESLAATMLEVLESDGIRQQARTRGLARSQEFGWTVTARKTAECYAAASDAL